MTVLAAAAGLLGELAFGVFDDRTDRFAVGNLGLADGGFDVEFALHAVNENFEVEFAHTRNDRLAGFFVGANAEGRVFLRQLVERGAHTLLPRVKGEGKGGFRLFPGRELFFRRCAGGFYGHCASF